MLTLITGTRAERLAERLAEDLARDPLSPFEEEVVVVQSRGTERWLRNELATRLGCAASTDFPFPATFCHGLARALGGDDDAIDPAFTREALTWRILELLEGDAVGGGAFAPLRRFVADGDTRKRLGLASRIAARFDDYQLYRADVLLAWERGDVDAADPHVRWQAALWRRLCGDGAPRHLARWFTDAVERIASAPERPPGLPRRISVFGVSTLPPLFIELLRAAGRFVPVRLYVTAPARATWQGLAKPASPLYAAFGHTSRELLTLCDGATTEWVELDGIEDAAPAPMLAALQHELRAAAGTGRGGSSGSAQRAPAGTDSPDRSLSLHVCHSPLREVEVLRDQLLDAFAADPTLRPHDILVMVPDVPTYTPLIEAVFGVGEAELPHIPHRVADRPLFQESSLAGALLRLLRLVGARCTVAEVLELFDVPAVRRAAGIDAAGAAAIPRWIEETRIRWGRDGAMRRDAFGVPAIDANSWRAGLDRLLMGYAVGPEDSLVAGILPHAGHTAGDPETLGAFAHWVSRLFDLLDEWRTPRPLHAWSASLREAVGAFLAPEDDTEEESLAQLLEGIDALRALEGYVDAQRALDLAVVRDWLERSLSDDGRGTGFLTGGMTVCALKPMRAIPFKVIAVLGLDDGAFPRTERRAGYDLLALDPRPGDPDRRADDRQLFLDTLLAARDRLILSYVGRSAKDNRERAVSVVVAELLDHVDAAFDAGRDAAGRPRAARDLVTVTHRLQPFAAEYYGADPTGKLFSYSRVNAEATAAAAGDRRPITPFVAAPLAAPTSEVLHLALADLIECYGNPARFFCLRTLGLRLPAEEGTLDDCEPLEVDNFTRYGIRERILRRHLAETRDRDAERLEAVARGDLPPGALTRVWYDHIDAEITDFLRAAELHRFEDPVTVQLEGQGWTVTGRVDGITGEGRTQLRAAKVANKDLVRAWITHLALVAAFGDTRTTVVGTDRSCSFGGVADAHALLATLVAGYRASLTAPLPFFEFASEAYARQQRSAGAKRPIDAARAAFTDGRFAQVADERDVYVRLCWRGRDPFGDIEAFDRWSTAVWTPLLEAMSTAELAGDGA